MKAIAVIPGKPNSMHLRDVSMPSVDDIPDGRGILVKVLRVGVDGTDREINEALYGKAPQGSDYLITGHESFGIVEKTGPNVREVKPGDFVVATVRRPGHSLYDRLGMYDMTTDDVYYERGINLLHGYLTEYYVDAPEYIISVPKGLKEIAVLMEPMSIAQKGITQAYEIQRRLRIWRPHKAAVMGSGTLGLLATLVLRLRGLDVVTFGRNDLPYRNAGLLGEIGARYVNTKTMSITDAGKAYGPFDIVLEGTGSSAVVFEAAQVVAKDGIMIMASVTGGDKTIEIPSDKINQEFVLGNKVMFGTVNANREYFETGVGDLSKAEMEYPGWTGKLLTNRVQGLENFPEMLRLLSDGKGTIKVFVEVAPLP